MVRKHPAEIPVGLNPDHNNSHQLRDGLRKKGWTVNETNEEVRILPQDVAADPATVSIPREPPEEPPLDPKEQFEFALESHLRDFIARTLQPFQFATEGSSCSSIARIAEAFEYSTNVGSIDVPHQKVVHS
jgi:hypothetical protein